MANAAILIDAISETDDPVRLAARLHRRAIDQLEPWFHDTVTLDNDTNALWTRAPPPVVPGPTVRSHTPRRSLRRVSTPVLNVAYTRYRNLLEAPSKFWTTPSTRRGSRPL